MPEDERIGSHFIVAPGKSGAKLRDGDLVACKITRFPDDGGEPECRVLKAFDGLDDVKAISQFITYKHNLPLRFKKSTGDEAKGISCVVPPQGRLDLRATRHVTIDGEFARDFDDAVCIEKKKNGYLLHVSIADVAHYVTPGSALDGEAYERGTSVYFPGSVIPMLPKELSNDVCSLKPREDRLTMTATLHFNNSGDLIKTAFAPSVIRSARRLTYTKVEEAVVAHDRTARKDLADVLPELDAMAELATLLKEKRNQRGALDFDLPEPEVILDIEGGISDILRSSHLFSHAIIEELMVATNEAVARFVADRKTPLMYRVHEPPDRGKLVDVEALLQALGVPCERDAGGALPLTAIVEKARGKPYEFLVSRVLLRSMKQAHYSSKNAGHFGLALDHYIHFTSPIRRYPDLVCHRVLKALLAGSKAPYDEKELERMALHLSQRERVAMEAERDLEDRVRVLFMKERLGEVYEGVISRITSFGFFVELSEVFVQGLVMLSGLHDDYYSFQEDKFRLIGARTKRVFRIGDMVRVKVLLADAATNRLHFGLVRR
jgi:ribonuclease R